MSRLKNGLARADIVPAGKEQEKTFVLLLRLNSKSKTNAF
jgi:hypothetical protein